MASDKDTLTAANARARPAQLAGIEISPSGLGLHFPQLDANLYLPALLEGFLGSRQWMASAMISFLLMLRSSLFLSSILRRSSAALLAATLVGCGTYTYTAINVDDQTAFIPSVRVSLPLSGQEGMPSEPQSGHAIELGYTVTKGSSSQTLVPGQNLISVGGVQFNAPQELRHEFDYRYAEILYRYRRFFGTSQNFGFEVLGGLVNSQLKLSTSSPSQMASAAANSNGISEGVGGIWRFRPTTSLQARYAVFVTTETSGNRTELFAVQALGANASIRGGYTWWYVHENGFKLVSDFEVRFRGPAVSLEVMF